MNTNNGPENRVLKQFKACAAAGALSLMLLPPLSAWSGGIVTNCTEPDLRAAMAGGGTVTFDCNGVITLASTITNSIDTAIDGSSHQVTISGNNAVRLFYVATNVTFKAVNITLAAGFSPGGSAILNVGGKVNLAGVKLTMNTASTAAGYEAAVPSGSGGAIFNAGGELTATNCSFSGNTATNMAPSGQARGGALRNQSGRVNLEWCNFTDNRADGGPAMYPQVVGSDAAGGAIENSGAITMTLCVMVQNSASAGAGYNLSGTAGGAASGGAICSSGDLRVTRSTFVSNTVTGGRGGDGWTGGVYMDQGLPGGLGGLGGSGHGGALFNSGTASVINCTIAGNTGRGGGGGPGGQGGGPYVRWGGNGGNGGSGGNGLGGVEGTCNLTNCTVAWNAGIGGMGGPGGAGGGGVIAPGAPGAAGTSGTAWPGTLCAALVNTLIASNSPAGGDSFPDPRLGPLANNGGPTPTMALLPGSPAIDAGDDSVAPATDQRGFPRAGLASDIGAFEYGSILPVLVISRSWETSLDLKAYGNAGKFCRLLTSTNLADWVPIATNQFSTGGTVLFHEAYDPGEASRFYRLIML